MPLSPIIFGIYIDKLERCLEEASCTGTNLVGIFVILLLYVDDIVILARSASEIHHQLRFLKDLCSNMGMSVNTNKTKVMIIKSKKDTYANFFYDNNNLEEVSSYKYLIIDIHHKIIWNYSIDKWINRGWKAHFFLENNCKSTNLMMWDKKKFLFETLVTPVILYSCEVWGCNISRESWIKIEKIQKCFITYNLKIKRDTIYHILLIEVGLPPIECITMYRYLIFFFPRK